MHTINTMKLNAWHIPCMSKIAEQFARRNHKESHLQVKLVYEIAIYQINKENQIISEVFQNACIQKTGSLMLVKFMDVSSLGTW